MSFAPYEVPAATEELLTPDKLPPNLAIYQTDINASYVLARLYAATENTTQAALYIDNAFELQADGSGTVAKSLSPSFDAGAYQLKAQLQAKAELSKANGRREEASQSLLEAARNYYFKNELKLALALFREAKELNPYQPLVYWYLADCLRMLSLENPSLVQDSIKVWEQGYALQPMDDDNSWAYLVRGLIYELQCNLPRVNPWVVAWRAVCCAEQAMMYPSAHNSVNYAYLGRFYRNVQLEANVLKATEKAVQLEENNTFALAERAVILANVGEFEQAEKVIDAWIKLEPGTALRDGIQGYVYWHRERKDEGFDLLKKAIEQDESVLWYREIRGYFYYLQGDIDLASQDCEWIWNKYKETRQLDIENINRYAEAAYILGKYDETLELLDRFPDSPFQDANSRYGLIGMSYLALGKLGPGEDALNTCVALISNRRQISDLLDELHILLTTSESWSHKEHIPEIVERVEERVHQRNNEIEHPIAPEQELAGIVERTGLAIQVEYGPEPVNIIQRVKERVQKRLSELEQPVVLEEEPLFILEQIVQAVQSEFESAPVEEGEDSIHFMEDTTDVVDSSDKWVWIAAMAGRARIFVEQMNWLEAAKIYSTLFVRAKEHFPEARLGIETVCDRLLDEMAKCFRENQLGTYYDEIRDAVQHLLSLILDDKQRLARACTQFVYLSFPQAGEADLSVADLIRLRKAEVYKLSTCTSKPLFIV